MRRLLVRALRPGAAVTALAALLLAVHLVSPRLGILYRESVLPEGYRHLGTFGRNELYARPGNRAAVAAARILEDFGESVLAEFGASLRLEPSDSPFVVIVFSSHADLVRYAREELGSDFATFGGFYRPDRHAMGVIGSEDPIEIVRPLFHEGTHLILDTWVRGGSIDWSRWFNEGLASYFEWSAIGTDGRIRRLGGLEAPRVRRLREDLRRGLWVPVSRLLAAGEEEFGSEENWRYYGEAALLVHLLLDGEGGRLRGRFFEWFRRERAPGPVTLSDFREVLGDPGEVDRRLRRHLLDLP